MKDGIVVIMVVVTFLFILIGVPYLQEKRDNIKKTEGMQLGMRTQMESYANEVPLEQVAVKGKVVFEAKVEIAYEDGKLIAVTLVPRSTAKKNQ